MSEQIGPPVVDTSSEGSGVVHADDLPQYSVTRASSVAPVRYERKAPDFYRLARMRDGTLVLQGAFYWQEGWASWGHEWRDIPTVDIDA